MFGIFPGGNVFFWKKKFGRISKEIVVKILIWMSGKIVGKINGNILKILVGVSVEISGWISKGILVEVLERIFKEDYL